MKHLLRRMKRRIFRKDKQLSDKSFHLPFYLFLYSYDFYTKKFYCNEINPRCDQSNWDSWERSRLGDWEYCCWVPAPKLLIGLGGKAWYFPAVSISFNPFSLYWEAFSISILQNLRIPESVEAVGYCCSDVEDGVYCSDCSCCRCCIDARPWLVLVKVWYGEYLTEDPELGRILPKKQLINEGDIFWSSTSPIWFMFIGCCNAGCRSGRFTKVGVGDDWGAGSMTSLLPRRAAVLADMTESLGWAFFTSTFLFFMVW